MLTGQAKQELSSEAPGVVRYLPAPQSTQALAVVAPVVMRYFPAMQSAHPVAPVKILYFPAMHAVHVPPFGPVYPRLQRQLVKRLLPIGETELSGQFWHNPISAEPETVLYVPALQSMQVLVVEAPQAVEYLPVSQLRHVVNTEAPTVVEYLPLLQSVQAWFPCVSLYFPASHAIHVPPSGPVYPTTHRQLVLRLLPLREKEFGEQDTHVVLEIAPGVPEYVLAAQAKQELSKEAPVVVRYLPAPHAMHAVSAAAPAVVRYLPAPQLVHVLTKVAPVAVEYLPAAQSVHAAKPIASLYFPATQPAHVPPFGPEYPRLQRQAETAVCPEADVTEYAGQV